MPKIPPTRKGRPERQPKRKRMRRLTPQQMQRLEQMQAAKISALTAKNILLQPIKTKKISAIKAIAKKHPDPETRRHAMWVLEQFKEDKRRRK